MKHSDINAMLLHAAAHRAYRLQVQEFNAIYANVLDYGDITLWPGFFCEQPFYRVVDSFNYGQGMRYGLIYCDSQGMLMDRVQAIKNAMMFEPRAITHITSDVRIKGVDEDQRQLQAESNFLLVENLIDRDPRNLMVGRYIDTFSLEENGLKIKSRECIYDSTVIQTSLIYPV